MSLGVSIQHIALGVALAEVSHGVREVGGNNRGPRIMQYLGNCDPPIHVAAPWCAAAVQFVFDVAARGVNIRNPLDVVVQEALVQSYYDALHENEVSAKNATWGDLALFKFGGSSRWNHIGIVSSPVDGANVFWSVEGNTGSRGSRDGDGYYVKPREIGLYPVTFIRPDPNVGLIPPPITTRSA